MTKILAVDDDEDILKLISFSLAQDKVGIVTARSGIEALQKTKELQPDIILLDVIMPVMDGYQVANRIMNDPLIIKKPKIILVTVRDVLHESKLMGFSGAVGSIQKPFEASRLKELIVQIVGDPAIFK